MNFDLPVAGAEPLVSAETCSTGPTVEELPHHDIVSVLSLAGGKLFFGFRRIANLDARELMRVFGQVQHVVHVSFLGRLSSLVADRHSSSQEGFGLTKHGLIFPAFCSPDCMHSGTIL